MIVLYVSKKGHDSLQLSTWSGIHFLICFIAGGAAAVHRHEASQHYDHQSRTRDRWVSLFRCGVWHRQRQGRLSCCHPCCRKFYLDRICLPQRWRRGFWMRLHHLIKVKGASGMGCAKSTKFIVLLSEINFFLCVRKWEVTLRVEVTVINTVHLRGQSFRPFGITHFSWESRICSNGGSSPRNRQVTPTWMWTETQAKTWRFRNSAQSDKTLRYFAHKNVLRSDEKILLVPLTNDWREPSEFHRSCTQLAFRFSPPTVHNPELLVPVRSISDRSVQKSGNSCTSGNTVAFYLPLGENNLCLPKI